MNEHQMAAFQRLCTELGHYGMQVTAITPFGYNAPAVVVIEYGGIGLKTERLILADGTIV